MSQFRIFILLALAIFAGSCARAPRPANTLVLVQDADPATLDPAKAYTTNNINLARVLYRGLVDYGAGADIVPAVARKWTISPDGKTYTFHLRDDVRFHSGRRVVAQDFSYALHRVMDPKTASDGYTFYRSIQGSEEYSKALEKIQELPTKEYEKRRDAMRIPGIETPDENTIVFRLKQPDLTFLNWLAMPFAYAIPRESVKEWGDKISEHPDGCGPYRLKAWEHDSYLELEKNEDYYDKSLPRAERILTKIGGDGTLNLMQFETGNADVISLEALNAPDFLRLRRDPKWKPLMMHAPMMDIRYLCMNVEKKPFNNVLVRRAMNYAINRDLIVNYLNGRAIRAKGALPPGMPAYNANLFEYSHNTEKARQLLKQAGYPNGFEVDLWYADSPEWYPRAAQFIQQDLKKVGIRLHLKQITYGELKKKAGKRGNIELSMMGWVQDFPDPSNFLDVLFNGNKISDESSPNRAFYSNPQVNKWLDEAAIETNRSKRNALYQKAEAQIVQDAPWVFLVHTERFVVRQPWVQGYQLHPMWSARYEYAEVTK
jgi:oligopeptide transport system substrate-binding protein